MDVSTIHGFGGVKFEQTRYGQVYTATFYLGTGSIKYSPKYIEKENISYKLIPLLLGFRVSTIVNLMNIRELDYIQFLELIKMINYMTTFGSTITIYPRYTDSVVYSGVGYAFGKIDSDIQFADISNIEIGQTLKLEMTRATLVQSIPRIVKVANINNLIFNTVNANFNTDNAILREA